MHKFKVGVGIGIMVVIGIPLLIEIVSGISDELSHLPQCPSHVSANSHYAIPLEPCQDYESSLKLSLVYAGLFNVGLWLLIFGLKEISIISFSKEL